MTNSMVNRMGATFVLRMQEDTGRTPAEIVRYSRNNRYPSDHFPVTARVRLVDR